MLQESILNVVFNPPLYLIFSRGYRYGAFWATLIKPLESTGRASFGPFGNKKDASRVRIPLTINVPVKYISDLNQKTLLKIPLL